MLKVKNIETWYDLIRALHGISFEINKGDVVALLGSNGAGKTTILKTIMRLFYDLKEEQPEKGSIEFLGQRIDRKDTADIVRMGIGYVPEGREVFPELTVMENINIGAYTRNDKKGIQSDLENVFTHFPILKQRMNQQAGLMSGGEQQMLAIGRGLISKPRVLLLDEPSLGLAPIIVQEIFRVIRQIHEEEGVSILLVEQNARKALGVARYGYILELGKVAIEGNACDLKNDERVRAAYLGGSKVNC